MLVESTRPTGRSRRSRDPTKVGVSREIANPEDPWTSRISFFPSALPPSPCPGEAAHGDSHGKPRWVPQLMGCTALRVVVVGRDDRAASISAPRASRLFRLVRGWRALACDPAMRGAGEGGFELVRWHPHPHPPSRDVEGRLKPGWTLLQAETLDPGSIRADDTRPRPLSRRSAPEGMQRLLEERGRAGGRRRGCVGEREEGRTAPSSTRGPSRLMIDKFVFAPSRHIDRFADKRAISGRSTSLT